MACIAPTNRVGNGPIVLIEEGGPHIREPHLGNFPGKRKSARFDLLLAVLTLSWLDCVD